MKKLRQKLCLVLVILAFSSFITANAVELDENLLPDIPEPYVGVTSISPTISINNAGLATCCGNVRINGGYTAWVTMDLQQLLGNAWNSVDSCSEQGKGIITIDNSHTVTSGYWYKVKLTVTVYDGTGNYVETASVDSSVHYY